jgi:hypothetical protein
MNSSPSARAAAVTLAVILLAACQSAPERPSAGIGSGRTGPDGEQDQPMSVDEVRALARRFTDPDAGLPPRSIADVDELLADLYPEPVACGSGNGSVGFAGQLTTRVDRERAGTPSLVGGLGDSLRLVAAAQRLTSLGRLAEAIALLEQEGERAAETSVAAVDGRGVFSSEVDDYLSRSMIYANLAQIQALAGDVEGAERSRNIAASRLGRDGAVSGALNGRGEEGARLRSYAALAHASAAQVAGRLPEAEARYRELLATTTWAAALAAGIDLARAGSLLAANLRQQGRVLDAERAARESLRGALQSLRGSALRARIGLPATQLAIALHAQGRMRDAESVARRAIVALESGCAGRHSLDLAQARRSLVQVLAAREDWEAIADELIRTRQTLDDDPHGFQRIYGNDPEVWFAAVRSGQAADALIGLRVLAARLARERGADDEAALEVRGFVGLAEHAAGDPVAALASLRFTVAPYLEGRFELGRARQGGLRIVLEGYSALLGELAAGGGAKRAGLVDEHFRVAQLLRLDQVQRGFGARASLAAAGPAQLAELAEQRHDAEQQRLAVGETLDFIAMVPRDAVDQQMRQALRERLDGLREKRHTLDAAIAERSRAYGELLRPRPLGTGEVQHLMRPGEALVVFLVSREDSWAWAIPQSGPIEYTRLGIDANTLDAWVQTLREGLDPRGVESLADVPAYDLEAAHALFEVTLSPVASGWRSAGDLMVVTDGALDRLPLGVLPTSAPVAVSGDAGLPFSAYRKVAWLAREHGISVLPTVSALAALDRTAGGASGGGPFVGFGDPVFTKPPDDGSESEDPGSPIVNPVATRDELFVVRTMPATRAARSAGLADLPGLPETADEVRGLAAALDARPETVYLGERASERNARDPRLARRKVVLLATHCLAPGDLDGLLQPALAFSTPAVTGGDSDGLLTLDEVLMLELDADWVILSGCDTGAAGGLGGGAISGLGRAFFYAGAQALLVSNWPVHSQATRELLTRMVAINVDELGRSRAQLLRLAMASMVDQGIQADADGKPVLSYAHPLFWAAFSVVGDGRGAMR